MPQVSCHVASLQDELALDVDAAAVLGHAAGDDAVSGGALARDRGVRDGQLRALLDDEHVVLTV